ncbi:uncharacterized protein [Clytia hemisphaerica]
MFVHWTTATCSLIIWGKLLEIEGNGIPIDQAFCRRFTKEIKDYSKKMNFLNRCVNEGGNLTKQRIREIMKDLKEEVSVDIGEDENYLIKELQLKNRKLQIKLAEEKSKNEKLRKCIVALEGTCNKLTTRITSLETLNNVQKCQSKKKRDEYRRSELAMQEEVTRLAELTVKYDQNELFLRSKLVEAEKENVKSSWTIDDLKKKRKSIEDKGQPSPKRSKPPAELVNERRLAIIQEFENDLNNKRSDHEEINDERGNIVEFEVETGSGPSEDMNERSEDVNDETEQSEEIIEPENEEENFDFTGPYVEGELLAGMNNGKAVLIEVTSSNNKNVYGKLYSNTLSMLSNFNFEKSCKLPLDNILETKPAAEKHSRRSTYRLNNFELIKSEMKEKKKKNFDFE